MTGCRDTVGTLRRVLVRSLRPEDVAGWREENWRAEPDLALAEEEHEAFRGILASRGAEVVLAEAPMAPNPDGIYTCDPALETPAGTILLRPGKAARRVEVDAIERDLLSAGAPIAGRLVGPGTAEGGDLLWLDARTLLAARSYRTNDAGLRQLRDLLPDVEVLAFDVPHQTGRDDVLHLRSLISPLDHDLALIYAPLIPARLMEELGARGIATIEVPDGEYPTMGTNVLALAPRVAVALEGNDGTRRRMEAAGVEVLTYRGEEISRKGDGGPTCLTRPIDRD